MVKRKVNVERMLKPYVIDPQVVRDRKAAKAWLDERREERMMERRAWND